MSDQQTIIFTLEDGTQAELEVLEETKINGINYLLVVDSEDDDTAFILKESSTDNDDTVYEAVEDDTQLNALSKVFSELLEDVDFE